MGIVARTLEDGTTHQHDPFDISTIVRRTSELAWVDMVDTGDDDLACLATEIGLIRPEPGP